MKKVICLLILVALALCSGGARAEEITQGTLQIINKQGKKTLECPLTHTRVQAAISGFIARVTVTQEFYNPAKDKIEAVYIFPLPAMSAVDDMTMTVGKRTIKGVIKEREEAKKIYAAARKAGQVASLLEQERPNIFTQSVANIMPGEKVRVQISYVEMLGYEAGTYEFVFPMVVGPRYIPGAALTSTGTGWSPDTTQVPDASRITPVVAPPGTRAGHDIAISVAIDAGVPLKSLKSVLHKVHIRHDDNSPQATVELQQDDSIPNKDFILQLETAGTKIEDAVLTHSGKNSGGFFTLVLQPPDAPRQSQISPKEMIFVIDTSGSQMGWPIEKAKETMKYCIENMNPDDSFQLMAFSNEVIKLFAQPRPNSKPNREAALEFLAQRMGSGGTEMLPAILAALEPKPDPRRLRIVCFMTDGYVGNDMEIITQVQKHIGAARLFPFGVGNSVNRYLLDKMAQMGKGEVEYVTLNRHADEVAEKFYGRIANPLLTDLKLDWGGLKVSQVYPKVLPDLFSAKPVIIKGRYHGGQNGVITLSGKVQGNIVTREIPVAFPANNPEHDVLASLWARTRIEDLMDQDLLNIQKGSPDKAIKSEIIALGLKFRLMSQFTSFVAVEEKVVTKGGIPRTVAVPVEMPEGVSYEGVFGQEKAESAKGAYGGTMSLKSAAMPAPAVKVSQSLAREADYYQPSTLELKPEAKLDSRLIDLESRVAKHGTRGNLALQTFKVKNGQIKVIVTLAYVSSRSLQHLTAAGLKIHSFSRSGKILTGTLALKKLQALAKLESVVRIEPFPGG